MSTVNITDSNFASFVRDTDGLVLVDYWAEWCNPCKMIAPALEELSEEMADKITVAKVNIDDNPETPAKYGVRGVPTLMIFKKGDVIATKVGALPKSQMEQWINSAIEQD